ncbi:class I SAM-dependent methyltransferase [Neptunomonas antarctica]|uniref:Ubiquinone/menaquinone biosynthesis C-methylase UbiE n=2 Tax=Neptunomonas antarctica TaxID=619304 RepID=A0A1N7JFQ5_9GAMM|nr:class I SAM-dependent methyltransferase [Neptunomonas antarctica]SIS48091.1 Ubiquinone/menaquinone biosynthesis C-methylase UbiE [Neptunomonas antarctica]
MMNLYRQHIFPYLLDKVSRKLDADRQRILPYLRGDVLELGAGTGVNFSFYSQQINSLIALEPEPALLLMAAQQRSSLEAKQAGRFYLIQGDGHHLPLASNSLDVVLCCLVLCSVSDPQQALLEIYRVLKPGGTLVVFEHVRSEHVFTRACQQLVNPLWKPLACGCHLQRHTFQYIEEAGFTTDKLETYRHQALPALVGTVLEGVAFKPF